MDVFKNKLSYRIVFTIDSLCLLLILGIQGAGMYYFFNQPYGLLFIAMDVICFCSFIITMIISYQYFTQSPDTSETDNKFVTNVKKHLQKLDFGILPMSYVCWLIYVFILIWKVNVIIGPLENSHLQNNGSQNDACTHQNSTLYCNLVESFGSYKLQKSALQVCLALASPIFMLLIEGHNWHNRSSNSYSFITDLCKKTGIEIFDSVEMYALLIERDDMSLTMEKIIFQLASLNFILPTLLLYQLNITNFGVKISKKTFRLSVLHNILRIAAINIPFFIARFYSWTVTKEISVFIMKNIFYVAISIRELYIDLWLYLKPIVPENKTGNEEVPLNQNENTQTDGSKMTARL